jgi:hypothetical protein
MLTRSAGAEEFSRSSDQVNHKNSQDPKSVPRLILVIDPEPLG